MSTTFSPKQRANINGTTLAYDVIGKGEPIVLIHGGIVANAYAPLLNESALADYQLVLYHRRGYGASARNTGPVSIPQQAEDALALMRHIGLARAHIVGYSYGGALALQLAQAAPDAVHSLALLEPIGIAGVPSDPQTQQIFFGTMQTTVGKYMSGDKAGALDTFCQAAFGPTYPEVLERVLPGALATAHADVDAFVSIEMPTLQQWAFTADAAKQIQCPILSAFHVDEYMSLFREAHESLLAWLPQTETLVVPNATHMLMMMNARSVATGLSDFFARHPLRMAVAA